MLCLGVLLMSTIYLLWENKRLKKTIKSSQDVPFEHVSMHESEPEPEPEPDPEPEPEPEPVEEMEDIVMNDYLVEEEIPEDLQKEIDNLNLDETLVTNQEEMIEEIIIDQRPEDDDMTRLEMEIKEKLENPPIVEEIPVEVEVEVEVPDLLDSIPSVTMVEENEYTEEKLNNMNLKKLTEICRNNKLKLKGKKSELIERILKANL